MPWDRKEEIEMLGRGDGMYSLCKAVPDLSLFDPEADGATTKETNARRRRCRTWQHTGERAVVRLG